MILRKLSRADESMLRVWLVQHDPAFAFHDQLKNYFLAETHDFGSYGIFSSSELIGVGFFSRFSGRGFLHHYLGDDSGIPLVLAELGGPCEIFMKEGQPVPDLAVWREVLKVTPGYVVDMPCYSGVFWRTVPRFAGTVYERD